MLLLSSGANLGARRQIMEPGGIAQHEIIIAPGSQQDYHRLGAVCCFSSQPVAAGVI
jgi:hypothetical protein